MFWEQTHAYAHLLYAMKVLNYPCNGIVLIYRVLLLCSWDFSWSKQKEKHMIVYAYSTWSSAMCSFVEALYYPSYPPDQMIQI